MSYKSEGLERLFLQLIKEKLTNLDKFPPLNYYKILNPSLFVPPTKISEKIPPHQHVSFEILVPPILFTKGEGGGELCLITIIMRNVYNVLENMHNCMTGSQQNVFE